MLYEVITNQDDVEICLRDLRGKWIVLYFYPKDSKTGLGTRIQLFFEAKHPDRVPEYEDHSYNFV